MLFKKKKVYKTVSVDEATYNLISSAAYTDRMTMAEVVREAVKEYTKGKTLIERIRREA